MIKIPSMYLKKIITIYTIGLLLSACSNTSTQVSNDNMATAVSGAHKQAAQQYRPIYQDSLYDLLLAEMALRRGQSEQATQLYLDQASAKQDIQLIAHATRLAHTLEAYPQAIEAADLWLNLQPNNYEALSIKAISLIGNGNSTNNFLQALPLLEGNALNPDTSLFTHLALNSKRSQHQLQLLSAFQALLVTHPNSHNLLLGTAFLYHKTNQPKQARLYINRALTIDETIETLLLNIDIASDDNKSAAIKKLKAYYKQHQSDVYIQNKAMTALIKFDPAFALKELTQIISKTPNAQHLLLLARVNIRLNNLRNADVILQRLLFSPGYKTQAHYLLGLIKRKQDLAQQAIPHLHLAREAEFLIPATEALVSTLLSLGESHSAIEQFKISRKKSRTPSEKLHLFLLEASLLHQIGNYKDSIKTYGKALVFFPENTQILYNRALIHFKENNTTAAINDLERILKNSPNYTPALNALAYHYINTNTNLDQAAAYIDLALTLEPDQAQYIDTKGWLEFTMKNYSAAIITLKKAYDIYPDPNIAAHLIEALWVKGNRKSSVAFWEKASINFPDNAILQTTLVRLNINTQAAYNDQPIADAPIELAHSTIKTHSVAIPSFSKTDPATSSIADKKMAIKPFTSTAVLAQTQTNSTTIAMTQNIPEELAQTTTSTTSKLAINTETMTPTTTTQQQQENAVAINEHRATIRPLFNQQIADKKPKPFIPIYEHNHNRIIFSKADLSQTRTLQSDNTTILTFPNNTYSIQLIASHDKTTLLRFINRLPSDFKIYTYTEQIDGKTWYKIIHAQYESYALAKEALTLLPATLSQYAPWIISTRELQQRINTPEFKKKLTNSPTNIGSSEQTNRLIIENQITTTVAIDTVFYEKNTVDNSFDKNELTTPIQPTIKTQTDKKIIVNDF